MDLDGLGKFIAAVCAALAALMTPFGVIYAASVSKRNRTTEASVTSLTEENTKLEERLEKTEALLLHEKESGLRWYQVLMVWFNLAHEMRRHALDARQVAESMSRLRELPAPQWNASIELPPLESLASFIPNNKQGKS